MRWLFGTRALFSAAAAMLVASALASCDQLDPVKTESLCNDRKLISMRCPKCQTPPYDAACSICAKEPAKSDQTMCMPPETTDDPSKDPGGSGKGGDGGDVESGAGGQSGSAGAGAGAGGRGGTGGRAQSGSGGRSGGAGTSGAGGPTNPPGYCDGDLACASGNSGKPACDKERHVCVPCTNDSYCGGMLPHCNLELQLCQNCYIDADCPGRTCDAENHVCIDCASDDQCTTDPVANNCDKTKHICVDCTSSAGCMDGTEIDTCDTSRSVCVDCLEDGDCHVEGKRACYADNQTCVQCTEDSHCTADPVNHTCDKINHVCVDCLEDSGCGGTKPLCDTEAQKCVECKDDPDCPSDHCVDQVCVECEADADCPDADAAHCDPNSHSCVGCTSSAQCGHLSETRACDTGSKRCVECNDDTTCGNFACLRAQHICSDVRTNSLAVCTECQADSMCMSPMKCVPMSFSNNNYGNFCAFPASSRSQGRCSNARPYSQTANARSVDGSNQSYCVPPTSTTCKGVHDATTPIGGASCMGSGQCGEGIGDASCNADGRCTYGCMEDADCPTSLMCLPGLSCGGGG